MKENQPKKEKGAAPKKKETHKERYARTWDTPIGQDCINLNETLAAWLGERLVFLADHTTTIKPESEEPWSDALRRNGLALQRYVRRHHEVADDGLNEAKQALEWVAKNLHSLWD